MARKILVVDDEPEIVKLVRAYLEQAGFVVVTAAEGQEALAVFLYESPNLVILDLNLPGWPVLAGRSSSTKAVPLCLC